MVPPELSRFGDYLDLHAERSPKAEAAVLGDWRLNYAELADPFCIVSTSGTTGTPKGAVLSHRSFMRCCTTQCRHWPVDPPRVLSNLPVNHIGGYCLVGGGTQVFMEHFDPQGVLETIEREWITVWLQMVSQVQRVAALQVEQVGRIDSGIEAGEHDGGEGGPDGELAVGGVRGEPAVAFE